MLRSTMKKIIVVYDTTEAEFLNDNVLNVDYARNYPGVLFWNCLYQRAMQLGWEMMASDVFLESSFANDRAILISHMFTPRTLRLIDAGVHPCVCLSGESPNVAWKFYREVVANTYGFGKYYLFRGMIEFIGREVDVSPFYWPNSVQTVDEGLPWEKRRFLVMIASNKSKYFTFRGRRVLSFCKWAFLKVLYYTNPIFRFEDLYQRRFDAIRYFSHIDGFDLFGRGWSSRKLLSKKEYRAVQKCYGGAIDSKFDTLKKYKFAICFENCVFPGYVTEKIFDCFLSGCIPVYMGAPDIDEFVPDDSYIDFRKFKNFAELECYLRNISSIESTRYLLAAENFLSSPEYRRFSDESLAINIVEDIKCYINRKR